MSCPVHSATTHFPNQILKQWSLNFPYSMIYRASLNSHYFAHLSSSLPARSRDAHSETSNMFSRGGNGNVSNFLMNSRNPISATIPSPSCPSRSWMPPNCPLRQSPPHSHSALPLSLESRCLTACYNPRLDQENTDSTSKSDWRDRHVSV